MRGNLIYTNIDLSGTFSNVALVESWVLIPEVTRMFVNRNISTENSALIGKWVLESSKLQKLNSALDVWNEEYNLTAPWLRRHLVIPQGRRVLKRSEVKQRKPFGKYVTTSLPMIQELFLRLPEQQQDQLGTAEGLWLRYWLGTGIATALAMVGLMPDAPKNKTQAYRRALEIDDYYLDNFNAGGSISLRSSGDELSDMISFNGGIWDQAASVAAGDADFDKVHFRPFEASHKSYLRAAERQTGKRFGLIQ